MTAAEVRAVQGYLLNRRRFLTMLGGAGALGVVGCSSAGSSAQPSGDPQAGRSGGRTSQAAPSEEATAEPEPTIRRPPGNPNRNLVVIELQGGNDGLAMLQPYETGLLQDDRPNLASLDEDLIDAGNGFGWHPMLAGLAGVGIAGLLGVGTELPNFSHFEMEQRWWRGDGAAHSRLSTGFLGRLCDQLDVGAPVTGLSLAGSTAALQADRAVTVGLSDPGANWFLQQDDEWYTMFRQTLGAMAEPSDTDDDRFRAARQGLSNTLRFAESLGVLTTDGETEYPWTELGQQLRFAADVLSLDVGVKVLHVQLGGFDTHSGQEWRYPQLMEELNNATLFFVEDLRRRNLFDETLIVTTSEFGRRVPANDGGTDHGGASTMLLCGPGTTGVHGEAPNLSELDEGNLMSTARLEDYYATIAHNWFGIDPADVLPTGGTPIEGIV